MEANNNSQLIKVAIVDDHYIVLDGMEKIIAESGIAMLSGKADQLRRTKQVKNNYT
jgi:DNA-binding NarL/FixJ family response regulator